MFAERIDAEWLHANPCELKTYMGCNPTGVHGQGATVALVGCYSYVFFSPFSVTGSYVGMALILAGTASNWTKFWHDARQQPLFWLVSALAAIVVVRSLLAFHEFPQLLEAKNPKWTDFLQTLPLIAFPMGWWLFRKPEHVAPLITVAILGLFAGILYGGAWDAILAGPGEHPYSWRFAFGYNPNYLGLAAAAATLTVLAWLLRSHASAWRWLLGPLGLVPLFFLVLASQSRSAWFGLALGVLAILLFTVTSSKGIMSRRSAGLLASAIILAFAPAVWILDGTNLGLNRMLTGSATIEMLVSGNLRDAAATGGAVGWRIGMWADGLHAFVERPWLGWGPGAAAIIPQAGFIDEPRAHFHNLYIEWLLAFGLFGLALAGAWAWILVSGAFEASRHGLWSPQMVAGLLGVGVTTAVVLFFTIRIGQAEGRAFLQLLQAFFILGLFRLAALREAERAARR